MAFKMKGHSLPGPYKKKGDPKKGSATGAKTKTSYSKEDVKTAKKFIGEKFIGTGVSKKALDRVKDRWKKKMTSGVDKASPGQKEMMSSLSGGKMPTKTVTKVTRAKNKKKLKS